LDAGQLAKALAEEDERSAQASGLQFFDEMWKFFHAKLFINIQ
jgi:hypothetical protein